MAGQDLNPLPRLAYVYHPLSFAPLSITDAARGVCQLVWVVDCRDPETARTARLLRKFGPVVDSGGRTLEETATLLGEHRPAGILSMHDSDLAWTADLAALLELPFHSPDAALKLTDKHAQRQALSAAGLRVPAFTVIPGGADLGAVAKLTGNFRYPAVLKPRFGQASRNTVPVSSPAAVLSTLVEMVGDPQADSEDYVLEELVPDARDALGGHGFANFVSVESAVNGGEVQNLSISGRTPFRWPFRETGYFTPCPLSEQLTIEVCEVAAQAARALGVTVGCLHTEIKLTDSGPVVIEVNGRPGGGMSEMLERASGFSILRAALRLAIGDSLNVHGLIPCSGVAYLLYTFPEAEGEFVLRVDGLSALREHEGVEEVVLVRGPGQRIDWREGSEAHVFHFAGHARDHDELRGLIRAAAELVQIEVTDAAGYALTGTSEP